MPCREGIPFLVSIFLPPPLNTLLENLPVSPSTQEPPGSAGVAVKHGDTPPPFRREQAKVCKKPENQEKPVQFCCSDNTANILKFSGKNGSIFPFSRVMK